MFLNSTNALAVLDFPRLSSITFSMSGLYEISGCVRGCVQLPSLQLLSLVSLCPFGTWVSCYNSTSVVFSSAGVNNAGCTSCASSTVSRYLCMILPFLFACR
jgi:hypothetical protein